MERYWGWCWGIGPFFLCGEEINGRDGGAVRELIFEKKVGVEM